MQRRIHNRYQSGLSIVELMVATVVSLIGVLVIFQVFAVNEGVRRTTTSGSDEQTSGLLGLLTIERDLRHAGFGINDPDLIGCNMKTYDAMRTPSAVPDFPLTPVEIVSNAGTTPDVIRVIYGASTQTSAAVKLGDNMDTPIENFKLISRFGFNPGDVVVVGQPTASLIDCTLAEITKTPGLIELEHGLTSYVIPSTGTNRTPRFNDPAGVPALYKYLAGAKVMNLGPFPVRAEMTVRNAEVDPKDNNQLVWQNVWSQIATAEPIAEQIVHLKAEYGMDDGNNNGTVLRPVYKADDDVVDNYTSVSPANAADWAHVRSVRVAIVSRSLTADQPPCSATPNFNPSVSNDTYPVRWARGPDAPKGRPIDVRTTADWQCYRYRVYETTVPLRNMLWRQE